MKLQVFIDGQWHYVFCRNESMRLPVICQDKTKAIKGNAHSLQYFQSNYANNEFRLYREAKI